MSATKTENANLVQPPRDVPATPVTALPQTESNVDDLRRQIAKGESPATPSVDEPQRLMKLYLTGQLSMGELTHRLKVHNNVVADTLIKEGKKSHTAQISYKEVPQASMANPGSDLNPDAQRHTAPKDSAQAEHDAQNEGDNEKRKEIEQQKEQLQKKEAFDHTVQLSIVEQTNREMKTSHVWRERQHQEKIKDEEYQAQKNENPEEASASSRLQKKGLVQRLEKSSAQIREKIEQKIEGGAKGQGR